MTPAFLTGSHRYGTPHAVSDIDLVLFVTPEEERRIREAFRFHRGPQDSAHYGGGGTLIKHDGVDLILVTDPDRYESWKRGTEELAQRAPTSRADAVATFQRHFRQEPSSGLPIFPASGIPFLSFVLLLVLFLTGCSLPQAPRDSLSLSERARVEFVEDPGWSRRIALLGLLDKAERVYRARFRVGPLDVRRVIFHPGTRLPSPWGHALGAADLLFRVMHVAQEGVPAYVIVHELHHLGVGGPGHEGPSWRTVNFLGRALWQESWL